MKSFFGSFYIFTSLVGVLLLVNPAPLKADMSGGNFRIYTDSFSFVDGGFISGGNYSITATGDYGTATTTVGGTFILHGGQQVGNVGILSFSVSPTSIAFGTLANNTVAASNVTLTVSTDSATGYTVSLAPDGALRTATGKTFANVGDGSVTAGSEEYGVRTSGSAGTLSSDTAVSTGLVVASGTGSAASEQTTLRFSIASAPGSVGGDYNQAITLTLTVNP